MKRRLQLSDLAFLSDCRSGALVDRSGAVVWWCPDRFDADAWFARVLGRKGGIWALTPTDLRETRRAYRTDTLVLETTFVTGSGVVELTEGLLFAQGARGHDIGLESPGALARSLRCVEGVVEVEHRFEPRSAYGLVTPPLERDGLVVKAQGSAMSLALAGAEGLDDQGSGVGCTLTLRAGERRDFTCAIAPTEGSAAPVDARTALEDTCLGWRSWTELHERPEGVLSDEIAFGVRVLQGLTYQQSGAGAV